MNQDDKSLQDLQLSELYRALPKQEPGAEQDAAILAAARRAAGSRPRPAFTPFGSGWRIPAALAAVLVLSIGLVHFTQQQTTLDDLFEGDITPQPAPAATSMQEKPVAPPLAEPVEAIKQEKLRKETGRTAVSPPMPLIEEDASHQSVDTLHFRGDAASAGDEAAGAMDMRGLLAPVDQPRMQATDKVMPEKSMPLGNELGLSDPDKMLTTIHGYREDGLTDQAIATARAMIRRYFGDDPVKMDPVKVSLDDKQWQSLIDECRALQLTVEADNLQQLLDRRP